MLFKYEDAALCAGDEEYWIMFKEAYTAALRFYKLGSWYNNADIWGGLPTQRQFTSLQAFWPGNLYKALPDEWYAWVTQGRHS